ncbi:MAG: 2-C-methyl-D-erythritol 4-phosphate cytidylyltransferase [Candidatus Acididesulfobacter diazotrophicus]|jgi:2-C-methyl-D-erythritol 4-phosphate cytidylyltransferase|uniref:2-C-methyl-D-erythritol 4-phosphate cytidylyltransferase n=1 Tax=Candidatus Acididesulfobacter diazotrophicus TaxID=2597226 RepID=A0A519BPP5_9DELT|nr:MAG: 2-C-methyl-D-erythritol 4-phosphate cytidylyltransferase [Candidatus Acididesulfobacter diazotrophicus]
MRGIGEDSLQTTKTYAVILASGTGKRTGFDIPKQLIKISGKELLIRSIEIFTNQYLPINFDNIIITVPPQNVFKFDWEKFINKKLIFNEYNNINNANNNDINDIDDIDANTDAIKKNYRKTDYANIHTNIIDKIKIIEGGDLRQKSVYNALNYIEYIEKKIIYSNDSIVFIHDAARPFVTNDEISLLYKAAVEFGASFLYSPLSDTIKTFKDSKINNNNNNTVKNIENIKDINNNDKNNKNKLDSANSELKYLSTLNRNNLIAAKTPQVFKFNLIKKAMDAVFKNDENIEKFTDDISFAENYGYPVKPIISNEFNIKITSSFDMELAEFLINKFNKMNTNNTNNKKINNK